MLSLLPASLPNRFISCTQVVEFLRGPPRVLLADMRAYMEKIRHLTNRVESLETDLKDVRFHPYAWIILVIVKQHLVQIG